MKLERIVLPRAKIQPEIMQATASFKNSILKTRLPIANFVFDDPVAFDAADSVCNTHPQRSMPVVHRFVQIRQGLASGFLFWL